MAYYSNFHHSNHPNFKQPYGQRPQHRSPRSSSDVYGGGSSSSASASASGLHHSASSMDGPSGYGGGGDHGGQSGGGGYGGGGHMGGGGSRYQNGGGGGGDRGSSGNTLWMGNIDESMDEQFIQYAFNAVGVNVQNIKIIRNKDTGLPVGYGFITFDDRNTAQNVLRELNGKKIPNVDEDKRFFLKPANRQSGGGPGGPQGGGGGGGGGGGQRLSIFVGNLSPEIDDEILLSAFLAYYPSVSSAKVITSDGQSKGFGFVAFDDEFDYQTALSNPNMMLGQTPISISRARHSNPGGPKGGGGPRGGGGYNSGGPGGIGGDNMRSRRPY